MAKKKLFGNQTDPRCETCARGKLSADGLAILCVRGGALPPTHSCRHYQYDPLRRVPKRRPVMDEFSAADFALDDLPETETTIVEPETEATPAVETPVVAETDSTMDHLIAYLNEHETPDAETILAILAGHTHNDDPVDEPVEESEDEPLSQEPLDEAVINSLIEEQAAQAARALQADDTPDIFEDLERLNMETVPPFALEPIPNADPDQLDLLLLPDETPSQFLTLPKESVMTEAPLQANDLLLFPDSKPIMPVASPHDMFKTLPKNE